MIPGATALERCDPWASAGEVVLYRLYDVGYEIDLARAMDLLSSRAAERARPVRGEAQAIQIANPPVTVRLDAERIDVGGLARPVQPSARLFDFGVLSIRATLSLQAVRPWRDLAATVAAITAADWSGRFSRWRKDLLARLAGAIVRQDDSGVVEDYFLVQVQSLHDGAAGALPMAALTDEHVSGLLFGEQRPLSATARAEMLSQRFSYFEDDLAVLAWNGALVVEPQSQDRDVQYVLEFANAQLLELRYYDTVLDRELPRIYDAIAAARRGFRVVGRRYGRLLGALQTRVTDATELVERVENSLKVTEDVYLARIYAAALEIFRGRTWRRGIDRKVGILRDVYGMLNDESLRRRAEVLEITIVLLIAVDIVLALLR